MHHRIARTATTERGVFAAGASIFWALPSRACRCGGGKQLPSIVDRTSSRTRSARVELCFHIKIIELCAAAAAAAADHHEAAEAQPARSREWSTYC